MIKETISLPNIVGKGYRDFWNFKGRYRVVKGSRGSKKSCTISLWYIVNLIKYSGSNVLVIRKTYNTLKNSCFAQLKWAVNRLGLNSYFLFKESPLEIIYIPTGQKILFRGLDDPLKITSIVVDKGSLCWVWLEEAYEITNEEDFNKLELSIRGVVNDDLFKQFTISFNPWNERHWLKRRFFDVKDDDILAITTTYKCNEWLDSADIKVFNDLEKNNPRRYKVEGLGEWGISEGLVYDNFTIEDYTLTDIQNKYNIETLSGLDFGYTNDETAFFVGFIDKEERVIFVYDEIYKKGLSNRQIAIEIQQKGYTKEKIIADSSEPKSIAELNTLGLRVRAAKKGRDSINHGIQFINNFRIIIKPRCKNFINEIENYAWDKDRLGNTLNKPKDEFNHLMDAMRYALEPYSIGKGTIQTFKGFI